MSTWKKLESDCLMLFVKGFPPLSKKLSKRDLYRVDMAMAAALVCGFCDEDEFPSTQLEKVPLSGAQR